MRTLLCQEQNLKVGPQILLERILRRNVIPLPAGVNEKPLAWHFHARQFQNLYLWQSVTFCIIQFWSNGVPLIDCFFSEDNWRFFEEHAKQFQNTPDFTVSDLSGQIFTPAPTPLLPSTKILQLRRYPGIGENCPDFCDFARSFCDLV